MTTKAIHAKAPSARFMNCQVNAAPAASSVKETTSRVSGYKRPRIRERSHSSPDPLAWIHANMYALVPEVRVILMTRSGLARGWRRKFDPIDHEIEQLKSTHGFEALTAAFALHQEANLIKDTNRSEKSRQLLLELLVILDHDNTLRRVR